MQIDPRRVWSMARHLAYTGGVHECPAELAKDLEQAAWLAYLKLKDKQTKYLWKELEYAMLEEKSRWIYQCKRGRGKNRELKYKMAMKDWHPSMTHPSPERVLILLEESRNARSAN